MKALAFIDDRWHPGEIPRHGLADLAEFEWIEDGRSFLDETLADHRIVVLAKSNHVHSGDTTPWVDERIACAFEDFVMRGGGLLVVHSGASGYAGIPAMRGLPAGSFVHHPPQCPVTVEPHPGHPLCEGVNAFTAMDEHYFMDCDDPEADVFLHSRSEHGVQPAGWCRSVGMGRVCILTPGHNLPVWLQPDFQRLLRNSLAWLATNNPPC